jgi:hypothetical protein
MKIFSTNIFEVTKERFVWVCDTAMPWPLATCMAFARVSRGATRPDIMTALPMAVSKR